MKIDYERFDEDFERVSELVQAEMLHAMGLWEGHPDRPLSDAQKSVEFWLMHIQRYLAYAIEGCRGTDKTKAMDNVRKIAALAFRAMTHHDTPGRLG